MKHFNATQKRLIEEGIVEYLTGAGNCKTYKELSQKLGFVSENTLQVYAVNIKKKYPDKFKNKRIVYDNLAVDYFKEIDSIKKAYLLGLLVSDGNINTKNKKFDVRFISTDKILVDFFNIELFNGEKCINCNYVNSTLNVNKLCAISISRKEFANHLINYNIKSKKEKLIEFRFDLIPKQFLNAFIRGVFDGDGCISYTKRKKKGKILGRLKPTLYICNDTESFILKLQSILKENGINMNIYHDGKIFYLKTASIPETIKFYNFIYNDNSEFFLPRKKEKFQYVNTEVTA